MKQIDALVGECIQKGYVTPEKAPWLRYALERRITSLITFIPLLLVGFLIADFATTLTFLITFCSLRSYVNGIHAKTFSRCFAYSVLMEIIFLGILPTLLNPILAVIILSVSVAIIWLFAPYNHPNMKLSEEEVIACSRKARKLLTTLVFAMIILRISKRMHWSNGVALGIVMTAFTLTLAYYPRKNTQKWSVILSWMVNFLSSIVE